MLFSVMVLIQLMLEVLTTDALSLSFHARYISTNSGACFSRDETVRNKRELIEPQLQMEWAGELSARR